MSQTSPPSPPTASVPEVPPTHALLDSIPRELADQALSFRAGGEVPVEARNAASVVLLREGDAGAEVYLLRRRTTMSFAAGFCVFPGGGVDPRDFDGDVAWAGPSAAEWAELLRCDEATARALVCAAVRETFEESGVLLAGESPSTVVDDTTGDAWEEDRRALEARELSFTDFLARRGLVLRTDLLRFWAHWITPEWEPRRFDTRFFLAVLPDGQVTRDVSTESQEVLWLPVGDVVEKVEAGNLAMLPPTYVNCRDLASHPSAQECLEAANTRTVSVVQPTVVANPDGTYRLDVTG